MRRHRQVRARAPSPWLDAGRWYNSHEETARAPSRAFAPGRQPAAARDAVARRPFAPIEEAIAAIRDGQMVVVVDDEDRENEGDLTIAAEKVTPEIDQLHGHAWPRPGLPGDDARAARRAGDSARSARNSSLRETAMCVSIDARGKTTTGISAADRAATVLDGDRAGHPAAGSAAARPRVPAARARRAACSCAPDTPRPRSIWRAWRA